MGIVCARVEVYVLYLGGASFSIEPQSCCELVSLEGLGLAESGEMGSNRRDEHPLATWRCVFFEWASASSSWVTCRLCVAAGIEPFRFQGGSRRIVWKRIIRPQRSRLRHGWSLAPARSLSISWRWGLGRFRCKRICAKP